MKPIIECIGLSKSYGGVRALDKMDLSIGSGKIVGLLGPNGSGKTTFIKLATKLLVPSRGKILLNGMEPGTESKKITSYLPDKTYFGNWMYIKDILAFFEDFYSDFDRAKALDMLKRLKLNPSDRLKNLSKGNREKVQLILVMSRNASLYLLDEPIAGVDPAARDYILETIINNYAENSTVIISTHLISDVEKVLDEVIFLKEGKIILHSTVDNIREEKNQSIDAYFREVFR